MSPAAACLADAAMVKQKLAIDMAGPNLLRSAAWTPWQQGFDLNGSVIRCHNGDNTVVQRGAGQHIELEQTAPTPIVAIAESRAENVTGGQNADYSLYLDIMYTDGTPQWGQIAAFSVGTHDWEQRQVLFMPEKPIASVAFYVLLRRHGGTAWFRNASLRQLETPAGTLMFDGVPVSLPAPLPAQGFQVRDVAADGSFLTFEDDRAADLALTWTRETSKEVTTLQAELRDTSGHDRAVTLYYCLTVPPGECTWLHDPRHESAVTDQRETINGQTFEAGANGRISRYPLAALRLGTGGLALAMDPFTPAFSRLCFNAGTRELFVAYDLALTPERPSARVRFCSFNFDGTWGFRAALARYYALFPEAFRCRTPKQGLWMPFAKISAVEGWEDFGFRFKEGDNETDWDDAHDITTFRYTEPMTWWMAMPPDVPRTLEAAELAARKLAAETPDSSNGKRARALLSSGHHDEHGRLVALLQNTPWCDGAVWSTNSMPGIQGDVTDFKLKWNNDLQARLYGPERKNDLDGEYVDSSEGYVTALLDFRRDHFAAAETPLTFSLHSRQPAIFRGLIAAEYVKALAADVHGMGKLMMANSTPTRLWFLAPYLDVMGTETNWNPGATWQPLSAEELLFRRAMSGPKPYCFLQNSVFEDFSHELVEKYMKRSLAFGMFPGFFSHNASEGHYFSRPELYNRDRSLFKTYIPLCKRVAEAGWQPVTMARCADSDILVERFGDSLLTVFNEATDAASVTLRLLLPATRVRDLVRGRDLALERTGGEPTMRLDLGPEDVAVLELTRE